MLLRLALAACLLVSACRIEDHTPAGSRKDENAIRDAVLNYYRAFNRRDWNACPRMFVPGAVITSQVRDSTGGVTTLATPACEFLHRLAGARTPGFEYRLIRTDLRQSGGIASVWASVQRVKPDSNGAPADETEDLVLERDSSGWKITLLTARWFDQP